MWLLVLVVMIVFVAVVIVAAWKGGTSSQESRPDYLWYAMHGLLDEVADGLAADVEAGYVSDRDLQTLADEAEWYDLHHGRHGTPYGAMDADLEDCDLY